MNWSKIKNIMIIVLVLINLFLLMNIAFSRYMSQSLPTGVDESFVSILLKHGITIDEKVVPDLYETRATISAKAFDVDFLTEAFIGEKVQYVSEGGSLVAPGGDKKLVINGNKIVFTTLKAAVPKDEVDIMKAVKSLGIGYESMFYEETTGYVKLKIDSVELEGMYLDVYLDENGLPASVTGVWPQITIEGENNKVSVFQAINSICVQLPKGSHITNVEKAYVLEGTDNGFNVKYAWRVYNQGRGYLCYAL